MDGVGGDRVDDALAEASHVRGRRGGVTQMVAFALTMDALRQTVRRVAWPALLSGVERGVRRVHPDAGVFRGGRDGGVRCLAGVDRGMTLL